MEKIKILEANIGNLGKGGIETFVWGLCEKIDSNRFSVDFLFKIQPNDNYIKQINARANKFFYIGADNSNKIVKQFKKFFFIRKVVKSNKYACIHIHTSTSFDTFIYYIACKSFCDNLIIHSHSTGIEANSIQHSSNDKFKYLLHKIFRHLICAKDITRLACSDLAAEWMYPSKYNYSIINNGIETSKFIFNQQIRDKIRLELKVENKFVVGHIGRFSYAKNHDFLIDIFNEVYKRNKNSVLLLVGTGELENQIKDKVHSLGLDDTVIFYGTTYNANELYQAMDCFVLPSHFEGMPMVLAEAQAASLKCLCSDVITKEAQITDLLEYMPLSDSAEKWAEKILSYNNDYMRKDMSSEIKKAGYDIKQSANQLEALYCSCSNKI